MSNRKRTLITTTIDPKIQAELKELSEKSMIPMSKLIDKAIKLLLEEYKDK